MATIVLSATGMALGGSIGGSVLGMSMATIGRAAGATLGRVIDQRILGTGSEPIESGRIDRLRLTSASEGAAIARVFGRMRVPGQVIWATRFNENATTTGGGKGAGPQPNTTTFTYSVSLAIALCEGEITRVGRVWADGVETASELLAMRVYHGTEDQLCDPTIEAVEGVGNAPAYRGLAYVVLEDLPLAQFGNRVPQFTFEVLRPSEDSDDESVADIARQIRGVALIPGTGEYSLATTPAYLGKGFGNKVPVNVNSPSGLTDFSTAVTSLNEELPNCKSTVLVVSWFGNDLRCEHCEIRPKVEQSVFDVESMPWNVSGVARVNAALVALENGQPVYGGTPTDQAVVEAIKDLNDRGLDTVFYPFILMEQLTGNSLPDPYSLGPSQPAFPWRGRVTVNSAPVNNNSSDQTALATAEVAAFIGDAELSDFTVVDGQVIYSGSDTWRYRRFILHYAHLCAAAGGVSAFCIGSEMRGMTQIRDENGNFPFVDALRVLASDVRQILGPNCKISYAADWSEYHGYQPSGSGDKLFNLDPLWADPNIDFIGIDNYLPLSDWRDGNDHTDAKWGSIYNLDYLEKNIEGGEGYDWFYHSSESRDAQIRTPITDGEGEAWIWRVKDLKNWWSNPHHNRESGTRNPVPTDWIPESKPIWFTEFGCAAIDKGTNQPNKFLDPKSSESGLPYYSNGGRDDYLQMQYLRAMYRHYNSEINNPVSAIYDDKMVDVGRMHVWAWDTRPFPFFPYVSELWADSENYERGHWLNGRASSRTIASVISELCLASGVTRFDVSDVHGVLRGYVFEDLLSARAAIQPLLLAFDIVVSEREGVLVFKSNFGYVPGKISNEQLAVIPELETSFSQQRASESETSGRVQVGFIDAESDYSSTVAETINAKEQTFAVTRSEFPLALRRSEGAAITDRWIQNAEAAKDVVQFGLPPSENSYEVGDHIVLCSGNSTGTYRIDRIEESGLRVVEATRVTSATASTATHNYKSAAISPILAPAPVELFLLDLPLLSSDDSIHAPYIAATSRNWPGAVTVYGSSVDNDYSISANQTQQNVIGITQNQLNQGPIGVWDRQAGLEINLVWGELSSKPIEAVLSGANTLAIGSASGSNWEVLQFKDAEPIAPNVFRVRNLLRGQVGTEGVQDAGWPEGSIAVLLQNDMARLDLPLALRGVRRHYRFGPASRAVNDASFRYQQFTYQGVSMRPYSVCHLRTASNNGSVQLDWIRRSRVDGDIWSETDVPLAELNEAYVVNVMQNGELKRTITTSAPSWQYSTAEQSNDLEPGNFEIDVAQVSDRFGPGPSRSISQVYAP